MHHLSRGAPYLRSHVAVLNQVADHLPLGVSVRLLDDFVTYFVTHRHVHEAGVFGDNLFTVGVSAAARTACQSINHEDTHQYCYKHPLTGNI